MNCFSPTSHHQASTWSEEAEPGALLTWRRAQITSLRLLYIVIIMRYLLTCCCSADFTLVWQVQYTSRGLNMWGFPVEALVTNEENKDFTIKVFQHGRVKVDLLTPPRPPHQWVTHWLDRVGWAGAGHAALLLQRLIHYSPDVKNSLHTNCTAVIKQQDRGTNYSWVSNRKEGMRWK